MAAVGLQRGSQPIPGVVYFNQRTGTLHAVWWSKSIFLTLNQFFEAKATFYFLLITICVK